MLDVKFTSSSMEEWWEMIAFAKIRHKVFESSFSQVITNLNPVSQVNFWLQKLLFFLHWTASKLDVQHGGQFLSRRLK